MGAILCAVIFVAIIFGLAGKLVYDGIKTKQKGKIVNALAVLVVFLILLVILIMSSK